MQFFRKASGKRLVEKCGGVYNALDNRERLSRQPPVVAPYGPACGGQNHLKNGETPMSCGKCGKPKPKKQPKKK
jgi:hypothetical protein